MRVRGERRLTFRARCYRVVWMALLATLLPAIACSALIVDRHLSRHYDNSCITVDFLIKYSPLMLPARNPKMLVVSVGSAEELTETYSLLYGCDILPEESKYNAEHPGQDGIVYMLWWNPGRKRDGSPKSIFDSLNPDKISKLNSSQDERIFSTMQEAMRSPQMAKAVAKHGVQKVYVQAFSLKGEDLGLTPVADSPFFAESKTTGGQ